MTKPAARLGIIGCGAVTQLCHLPAARSTNEVKVVALADKDIARARLLGRRFGIDDCVDDYHQFLKNVDGVIVAVPPYLHAPVARELLELGVPVLVEKPFTLNVAEAAKLIEVAKASKVALQVAHEYRFSKATRLVKRIIGEGWLGTLRSFSLEYGSVFNWPVASGSVWKKEHAGGGVLIDSGPHMLDLLLWWLGEVVDVEYRDDSLGGVEADCTLSLTLKSPTGVVRGDVVLSRLRSLTSAAHIIGDRFALECRLHGQYQVRIQPSMWDGAALAFASDFGTLQGDSYRQLFVEQLRAFAQTILEGSEPVVSGESALGSLALIERCYRERKPQELPWLKPGVARI
jgi:predicted dehydrogenase